MWLLYAQPETRFDGVAMRFMDIRKRVYEVGPRGEGVGWGPMSAL